MASPILQPCSDTADAPAAIRRVMIWNIPRSLSTVLCKCLSFIPGIRIFYEPYLAAWQLGPERENHGKPNEDLFEKYYPTVVQELLKADDELKRLFADTNWFDSESWTFDSVKNRLEASFADDPNVNIVLSKDPAYAITGNYDKIPKGYQHVFLIRHPLKTTISLKKMMSQMHDYFKEDAADNEQSPLKLLSNFRYADIYPLYQYIVKSHQENPIVIDADDLQNNPASILRQLLEAVGIPYQDSFTSWEKGDEFVKAWVISKTFMYGHILGGDNGYFSNAFNSTHFKPVKEASSRESLSQDVIDIADSVMPMYEELYQARLKP